MVVAPENKGNRRNKEESEEKSKQEPEEFIISGEITWTTKIRRTEILDKEKGRSKDIIFL